MGGGSSAAGGSRGRAGKISKFGDGRSAPASRREAELENRLESTRGGFISIDN